MGRFVRSPQPLPRTPTFPVWSKQRGKTYVVFIDETFQRFFELNERGYFCYGAVGIPESNYEAVTEKFAPVLQRYRELLVPELSELKHREFKRIPFTERWALARQMRDLLFEHSCFVSGFYTPARAYLRSASGHASWTR